MHEAKRGKELLLFLTLATISFSAFFVTANAATPTMDLTTTSSFAGGTASYVFHVENPTSTCNAFTVTIPIGYTIDPNYFTTTPNIVLPGVSGSFGLFPSGAITLRTTTTSGQFTIFAVLGGVPISIGIATIVPATSSSPGAVSGLLDGGFFLDPGMYVDLEVVVINPSVPGVYTWAPNTITTSGGSILAMDPRPDHTNQVTIIAASVGGKMLPVNHVQVLGPWITVMLVVTVVAVKTLVIKRKRHSNP